MNILKKLKRTFFITGIGILILVSGAFIYLYLNRNIINSLLLKQISRQLNSRFSYSDISVSLFASFPYASVSLNNFIINGTLKDINEPLLKMKSIQFSFNLTDIYHKKYYFKTLTLEEGSLNLIINPDGSANFELFKQKDKRDTASDYEIRKIKLKNTEVIFHNRKEKVFAEFFAYKLQIENNTKRLKGELFMEGNLLIKKINFQYDMFPEDLPAEFSATVHIDPDGKKISAKDFKVTLKNIHANIFAEYDYGTRKYYKSQIAIEENRLKEIVSAFPAGWTEDVTAYLADGTGELKIRIYGSYENATPHFTVEFRCHKSTITDSDKKWKIENADFNGSFSNGEGREPGTSTLTISSLYGLFMDRGIKAYLTVKNFYNPWVSISAEGSLEVSRLHELIPLKNIILHKGELDFFLQWEGRPGRNAPALMNHIIQKAGFKGNDIQLTLTDTNTKKADEKSNILFNNLNFMIEMGAKKIISPDISFSTQNSDYAFSETSLVFPGESSSNWICTANLNSNNTDLYELTGIMNTLLNSNKNNSHFPLSLTININSKKLSYNLYKADGGNGILIYEPGKLNLDNFLFSAFGGKIATELDIITLSTLQKKIVGTLRLEKLNIKKLFKVMSDLNPETLTAENLDGDVTGFLQFESMIDSLNSFDLHAPGGDADLVISSGKLVNYKPLQKLARFVESDLLNDLRFKEIHAVFSFAEGIISFPETEIISNVTTLWFSGTVSKTSEFDLRVKIRLPKHRRKRKTQEEAAGVVEDDGLGNTLLFLKINGTPEKLNISYDTEAVKNRIKEAWEKEKKEFKNIFRKESKDDSIKTLKPSEEEFKFDD